MVIKNYGILTSVYWNSNKWQALSTEDDLKNSKLGDGFESGTTYTSFNFGHDVFPSDENGFYHGLLPQLWSKLIDREKFTLVEIAFIKALNWETKENLIVGLYAFPAFRPTTKSIVIDEIEKDVEVNIQAVPKNVVLVENGINLS